MKAVKNFLFYNNTVPLLFAVLFLGTSLTFAANEDAREAIINSESQLTSVDNTFIRNVNLNTFEVEISVDSIEEDTLFYYVSYTISTISIVDGSWQPVVETRIMEISKEAVGDNDLGVLITKQLADVYEYEMKLLKETQEIENSIGRTQKVITTEYDGIVGRMFDPENEVFPGYNPVVTPPPAIPDTRPRTFEEELDNGNTVVIETPNSNQNNNESDNQTASSTEQTNETSTSTESTATSTETTSTSTEAGTSTTPATEEPVESEPVIEPEPAASSTEPEPEPPTEDQTPPEETTPEPTNASST